MSDSAWPTRLCTLFLPALLVILPLRGSSDEVTGANRPVVFKNATLYTGAASADQPIPNSVLVVKEGKVVGVGTEETVEIPRDAVVHDLKGKTIIPGLIDTHSHIGIYPRPNVPAHSDGNELTGPVQPGGRALDAIWPDDPGIRMATAGGVTTVNIMPGSGNVIGGQTLYVKLRGRTVEEMQLTGRLADGTVILGGLKMANGENPKGYGRRGAAPYTRMKLASLQREQFVKAREYQARLKAAAADKNVKAPERDVSLEPLVEVLERKRTVHFHCHRADDLTTAIRIAEEFGFELVLQHATEGYRIADLLAKKKIPVSLTIVDSPGGKAETIGLLEENAAVLAQAGVDVTINTDDYITESRFLLRTAAVAVRGGMTEAQALRAVTLTAARLLHLDHRIGSLEPGKDADFVVLSGSPFSTYTHVLETYIDGKKVFDRSNKSDWGYQVGGYALANQAELPAVHPPVPVPSAVAAPVVKTTREAAGKKLIVLTGRIHTAAGPPLMRGAIVVENGLITGVFKQEDLTIPGDATILTAAEVTPGLIDAFSTAGVSGAWNIPADQDQDEASDANQADLRVLDGFNPREPLLEFLRANGTTIAHVTPGRTNVVAGQSAVFRLAGPTAESAALKLPAAILVNLGEVPKEANKAKGPQTRMGVARLVRELFAQAQAHRGKADAPKNAKLEALLPALEGTIPVYFAAHRADDIATALRIAKEFHLKPVIALGTECYRMAEDLKAAGVPVVVHPTMQRAAGTMETLHSFLGNAAVLADKGIPVSICTGYEGYVPKTRVLRHEAAMAAANGLGWDRALRAVTIEPAGLLGIADKYGSIEKGKVADLVLYDGDPFAHTTNVTLTIMGGTVVYNRADYLKLPFERRILPLLGGGPGTGCCLGVW